MPYDIRFLLEESLREPCDIVNPVSKGAAEEKAYRLNETAIALRPKVDALARRIDLEIGCLSEISVKRRENILSKGTRPSIVAAKPWFDVEHLRDCLRFRSSLSSCDQFLEILRHLEQLVMDNEISLVKLDMEKFFRPSVFGWRMIAVDLRLKPSDFLVEYYFTYVDIISVNERFLHAIFERWRNRDMNAMLLGEIRQRSEDIGIACYTADAWMLRSLACDDGSMMRTSPASVMARNGRNPALECQELSDDQIRISLSHIESALRGQVIY